MPNSVVGQNPIAQFQAKFKELEEGFKGWLAKQSLPVEAAVVTVTSAAQGAAIGAFMGTLTNDAASVFPTPPDAAAFNPQAMASLKQAQVHSSSLLNPHSFNFPFQSSMYSFMYLQNMCV